MSLKSNTGVDRQESENEIVDDEPGGSSLVAKTDCIEVEEGKTVQPEVSVPNWYPNWREIGEYPNPILTTPKEWAWEFLRRNKEYQANYQNFTKLLLEVSRSDQDIIHISRSERAGQYSTILEFLTEDKLGQTILEITPQIIEFCNPIQNKFKVCAPGGLPDPGKGYGEAMPTFLVAPEQQVKVYSPYARMILPLKGGMIEKRPDMFFQAIDIEKIVRNNEEKISVSIRPTELLFTIDLLCNYGAQIQAVKDLVKREKKALEKAVEGHPSDLGKRVTKSYENKAEILAISDAEIANTDKIDLIAHFFPELLSINLDEGYSRVAKLSKTARKYIYNGGYLKLASL